jgi:hypothetical protein
MAKRKKGGTFYKLDVDEPVPALRIDAEFHRPMRRLQKRLHLGATRLVNTALRELLEKHGEWPPRRPASRGRRR